MELKDVVCNWETSKDAGADKDIALSSSTFSLKGTKSRPTILLEPH